MVDSAERQKLEQQLVDAMQRADASQEQLDRLEDQLDAAYPGWRPGYRSDNPRITELMQRYEVGFVMLQELRQKAAHARLRLDALDTPPTVEIVPDLEWEREPPMDVPSPLYDDGHHFGWKARTTNVGPTGRLILWGGLGLGVILVIALAYAVLGRPSGTSSVGAAVGPSAPVATVTAAAGCASLAPEDLTFTGLPGTSGVVRVSADCGVVTSATSPHCRVAIGTVDARGLRNPSLWDERIGFDAGTYHFDVFFQASWYDPAPYVIAVPGRGFFPDPNQPAQPRGGTADIKMYAGTKGAATTLGWTAESGTITFNTELDPQHPAGGGTVDMQMGGGAANAPIHISGTWHAEQPCATQ